MNDVETIKNMPLNSIPETARANLCKGFSFPNDMTVWEVSEVMKTRSPFATTDGLYFINNNGKVIACDNEPCHCNTAEAPGDLKEACSMAINDTPMPLDEDVVGNIYKYISDAFAMQERHI